MVKKAPGRPAFCVGMGSRGILWCWAAWWAAAEATSCVFVDNVLDHAAEGRIVVAADMDNDGNVDVITSNDGAFTVFYGDGDGRARPKFY